jgi:ankyrin repeat protein
VREEKNCDWDELTIYMAASQGNLEMLKYCVANKCPINEWACTEAARNGHLEVLKYLREEVKAPWDWRTADEAAQNGHLHILEYLVGRAALEGNLNKVRYCAQYCVANECSIDREACANAALKGHLACLKYLHEKAKAPWDRRTAHWAALNGHLHILKYLVERKFDEFTEWACEDAAKNGHLDCLKYLHETAKVRWTSSRAVRKAFDNAQLRWAKNNAQFKCVHYLLDNNCPIPRNWRIDEHGELHHPGN